MYSYDDYICKMKNIIDISGQRFERLLVLKFVERKNKHSYFECICDCGKKIITTSNALKRKHNMSCGCLNYELIKKRNLKHGLSKHTLFKTWCDMKNRCYYEKHNRYKNYGQKGIIVCSEWLVFLNFYNWAIKNGWEEGLTIDRIDNSKNYEPSNCRFLTKKLQNRNRTTNRYFTYMGETKTIIEWSEKLNIKYETLRQRIKKHNKIYLN
jgi:hypothetical protein